MPRTSTRPLNRLAVEPVHEALDLGYTQNLWNDGKARLHATRSNGAKQRRRARLPLLRCQELLPKHRAHDRPEACLRLQAECRGLFPRHMHYTVFYSQRQVVPVRKVLRGYTPRRATKLHWLRLSQRGINVGLESCNIGKERKGCPHLQIRKGKLQISLGTVCIRGNGGQHADNTQRCGRGPFQLVSPF